MRGGEQVLVIERPGVAAVHIEPSSDPLPEGAFEIRTVYSGLSAGTELSFFKGTNPYLAASWDSQLGLFRPGRPTTSYPISGLGYMEVGRVVTTRTPRVASGMLLAMTYGHRSGYRARPLVDRAVPLPDDLDPLLGIYLAHMGPICANGLLHAAADRQGNDVSALGAGVCGRQVVVIGAGVVGMLTALFARHHGADSVVVVDTTEQRRAVATALGLPALDPEAEDPAVVLKSRWRHGPGDCGADVVFQCRGQAASLALAFRLLRPQGTVIDLAFYQEGADEVRLGEEFHHNGLTLRCAQIGRVPRGLGHQWDRERLSAETLSLLRAEGDDIIEHLITDFVPLSAAPALLTELAEKRRQTLQVVFTFDGEA